MRSHLIWGVPVPLVTRGTGTPHHIWNDFIYDTSYMKWLDIWHCFTSLHYIWHDNSQVIHVNANRYTSHVRVWHDVWHHSYECDMTTVMWYTWMSESVYTSCHTRMSDITHVNMLRHICECAVSRIVRALQQSCDTCEYGIYMVYTSFTCTPSYIYEESPHMGSPGTPSD